jgi:hypothetical protein
VGRLSIVGQVTIQWRAVIFAVALFWFWYLVPVVAALH